MFGFESEGVYNKTDVDGFDVEHPALADKAGLADEKTYGLYANLFVKVDPVKAGFVYAYGSADEDDGSFNWGDDFDVLTVMDDYIANTDDAGLTGYTVYKVYADVTFGKISAGLAFGYGKNNADWSSNETKDGKFTEYDANVSYAFDANTTYTIAGGLAKTKDFFAKDLDADAYRIYHKMAVKF